MFRTEFILPLAAVIAVAPAFAAAGDSSDQASTTTRCRIFALNKAPAGDVYIKVGGRYSTIAISADYVCPSVRMDVKDGIVFYRKVAAPAPKPGETKAKDGYEPFASCAPDGKSPRQLVFLAPDGKDGWQAMAKSDAGSEFPLGTRLIFNLSAIPVAMDFGGTQLVVSPKKSALLGPAKAAPDGLARIQMARRASSGTWVPFLSSVWRQTTEERTILLVYPVAGTENVAFSCIPDMIEPKDDPEKKASGKTK